MFTEHLRNRKVTTGGRCALASLMVFSLAGGLAGAAHANGGHIATLRNVAGDVSVTRDAATLDGDSGMKLFVSDRIVSAGDASATIVFKDATVLTVGPSADVEVKSYVFEPRRDRFDFLLYIAKGAAVYTSGLMGRMSPETVRVGTPIATIGIRGTRFIVDAGTGQP